MALEILSGPYPITVDGVAIDSFSGGPSATWIQGLGLYGAFTPHTETAKECVAQMDGVCYRRSPFSLGALVIDLRADSQGLACRGDFSLYAVNYLAARFDPAAPIFTPGGFIAEICAICEDRFLTFPGAAVQSSQIADGVTFTTEYTFPGSFGGGGFLTVSHGRSAGELCLAWGTSGQIRFYDTIGKTQRDSTLYVGETFDAVVYVPKWDVFVEVKAGAVKVLADAIRPASISNPALSPAATAGEVSVATVQVLGAQGEPCVGELVDWSITSGGGSLDATQSTTDGSGYATVNYIAPIGLTGTATLAANVNF